MTNNKKKEQININVHSDKAEFVKVIHEGLVNGGIHVNASKGHGKTRLLFSMAQSLRNLDTCRVFIFDGSEAWLYGYSAIPVFTVKERDIQLINDVQSTDDIERYELLNWNMVKLALATHKDMLFRLKTRKPSKRGFFIRTVINHLDALQRIDRATTKDNEAKQHIAFFIEEAQDAFNSRSTTRLEAEEFLTVFNEARNQKIAFYTASQRLTDFSKTIRTKQHYCLGNISIEDKVQGIRNLEKQHDIDFSKIPLRHWFYEGKIFESPIWKQQGKPYKINKDIKALFMANLKPQQPQKKKSKLRRFFNAVDMMLTGNPHLKTARTNRNLNSDKSEQESNSFFEEQEENDLEEIEEEWIS